MRTWLCLSLLLFNAASAVARPDAPTLDAVPLALDPGDPAHVTVGRLRYLGGWVLTSQDRQFGGLSSLTVRDGRFLALSDTGWLFSFDRRGARFAGLSRIALRDPRGGFPANKIDRDTESMAWSPDGTRLWVGLEEQNAIRRYGDPAAPAEAESRPKAMSDWPPGTGPETMVRLHDGRFLLLSEDADGPGGARDALLFDRDPTDPAARSTRFGYRPPRGFSATDAAELPDGRLLVLNRRFSPLDGVAAAVTIIDPARIVPGAVLTGEEIARLEPPLSVDNMEGVAVTQDAGQTIVWLVSDDNYNPIERTLLMKFALLPR